MPIELPAVTILGLVIGVLPAHEQEPIKSKAEQIEGMVRHFHDHGMFNGAALVVEGGEVLFTGAFGLADFRDGTPLTLDSSFYLASVSKQFTATAILMLADAGKLTLEDRLADHVPEVAELARDATIHQLLTHTAGIPDHYNDLRADPEGMTNDQVVELLLGHGRLNFAPGTRFQYSNGGYVLLSEVVEAVSGQSLGEFAEEKIFGPLGMQHTRFAENDETIPGRTIGSDTAGAPDDYTSYSTGAGGMFSTVGDLAIWDAALRAGKVLQPETLEAAFTPHAEMPDGQSYGYGWMLRRVGPETVASHAGRLAGFQCVILRFLRGEHCIVLLSNQGETVATSLVGSIVSVLMGGTPRPQRVRIGPYLAAIIRVEGVDSALARYDEILAGDRGGFDLGENELNSLGYAYLRAGETDTAVAVHRKNTETFPESSNAWDSLAETLMKRGDRREAIIHYARSLVLNPDNTHAIEMLQALKGN